MSGLPAAGWGRIFLVLCGFFLSFVDFIFSACHCLRFFCLENSDCNANAKAAIQRASSAS